MRVSKRLPINVKYFLFMLSSLKSCGTSKGDGSKHPICYTIQDSLTPFSLTFLGRGTVTIYVTA